MNLTIQDVLNLYVDPDILLVEVYDVDKGDTIFKGEACDMPYCIEYAEITSIDNPDKSGYLVFNVTTEAVEHEE